MKILDEEIFLTDYDLDHSKRIVYAPLRSSVFLIEMSLANKLEQVLDYEVMDFFNYLKTKNKIDIYNVLNIQSHEVPNLSISLTDDCNLRCVYCHANAGEISDHFSIKNIETVIVEYFNLLDKDYPNAKDVQLSFMGGGEPTIKFALMSYAIKRCRTETRKRNLDLHVVTATNGCYSRKIADFLIKEYSHISFSFDGPPFIQNVHRPFKNGNPTFEIAYNNAKYLYDKKKSFSFRSTISKLTIENYKLFIDFFCEHFPGISVGVEPLSKFGRGKNSEIAPSLDEFHEFVKDVSEYSINKPIEVRNSSLNKLQLIRTFFCRAVSAPSFNVNPQGELWACARENAPNIFLYGKFDFLMKTLTIDECKKNALKNSNVLNFPECKDCISKYHCAGDCPDYRFEKVLRCKTNKFLTSQMLNQYLKN